MRFVMPWDLTYPISFRFSVCDRVSGGIEVVEARIYARMLEEAGVDLLNCSTRNA